MDSPEKQLFSLTSRGGGYYQAFFGLKPEDLEGKIILNLGSGYSDLQRDFEHLGFAVQVFNLDINYGEQIKNGVSFSVPGNSIRADFNRLPIKEDTIDICFSSWAISLIKNEKDFLLTVSEVIKLLKPSGIFLLADKKEKKEFWVIFFEIRR